MTSPLECNARAALCRQFARLEPNSKDIWLAEAERWSRLTQEPTVATQYCLRKPKLLDFKTTEVQFEFRSTMGKDRFEAFQNDLPFGASEPN